MEYHYLIVRPLTLLTHQVSHILFVDSLVGAGFSFSREPKGYDVGDISASLQLYDFLTKVQYKLHAFRQSFSTYIMV